MPLNKHPQVLIGIDARNSNWLKTIREIDKISDFGYFSSLHLPEYNLKEQLIFLHELSKHIGTRPLMVDISYENFQLIHKDFHFKKMFSQIKIDWLRLDVGFKIRLFQHNLAEYKNIQGLCINASTLNEDEIKQWKLFCKNNKLDLTASHNYYPKQYTGLSLDTVDAMQKIFQQHKIYTWGFVPNINNPKPPLCDGLPTIEMMRNNSLKENLLIACTQNIFSGIIIADKVNTNELVTIKDIYLGKKVYIKVNLMNNLTEAEIKIINKPHFFRNDKSTYLLRSTASRLYAQSGSLVTPHNQKKRERGTITIDNKLFKRYSGELCIVLKNLPKDTRTNVVGWINRQDLKIMDYLNSQYEVVFVVNN
ncbi:MAG: MupG family TIM beta-alpha barrel fold protein [Mycoplasmataceae bacterium]|nr:MupG family TIM beta-alpha barrel fold protein [Mycoplasmataceae bacterium]